MSQPRDVKKELTEYLRELHLPAIGRCFEDQARQAERETLGYEQYLLELVERECQERREKRIVRLLQASKLPLEKTLENFDLKRLPQKAARQVKALLDGTLELARKKLPARVYSKDLIELIFRQPYTKGQFLVDAGIAERKTAADYLKALEDVGVLRNQKVGKENLYLNVRLYELLSR